MKHENAFPVQTFTKSNPALINNFFFAIIQSSQLAGLPRRKKLRLPNELRKMGIFKAKRQVLCLLLLLLFTKMDPSTKRNGADNRILERQSDAGESPKGMSMCSGAAYVTVNVGIFNHMTL